jgi:heat shock protein HslJ
MRLVLVALLLVLTACGQRAADNAGGAAGPAPDPLRGRTFLATAVSEDGRPRDLPLSLQFTDDGRLVARAACNTMQGEVDTSDGKLVIQGEGLSTTDMGCDEARHADDTFVAEVLGASPSWRLAGDELTITSGTTTFELAPREAVEPDRELVGTTWELDTLVDGQTASSMAAGARPVTLVFDGTVIRADTQCNGVHGEYTIDGDTIDVALGPMTKMACAPEIMQGENAVVDVLGGKVKYEITADRLTLTNTSGKGIQLHAK